MNDVNRNKKYVTRESYGKRACFPIKRDTNGGCVNQAECIDINRQLDEDEHQINEMRRKYDISEFGRNRFDTMYMIDPSIDGPKEDTVEMNTFLTAARVACPSRVNTSLTADYLINPNHLNNFRSPSEEQWTYEPGSESIVRRKKDLIERQKLRIYPHMYNAGEVKRRDAERALEQQRMFGAIPAEVRGGTDYPIPMYFELTPLQGMTSGPGVDYDMRLRQSRPATGSLPIWNDKTLPSQLSVQNNVDIDRAEQSRPIQAAILNGELERDYDALLGRPVQPGAPQPFRKDFTCQQVKRKKAQEKAIRDQPGQWYQSKEVVGDGCRSVPRVVEPQSLTEKNVFGGNDTANASIAKDAGPKYPQSIDQPSGFFELGPALPPPNPLLLSNVPSRLLMYEQAINSTGDRDADAQLRLNTDVKEGFDPLQIVEGTKQTGIFQTLRPITVKPGANVAQPYPTNQQPPTALPTNTNAEFSIARSSAEGELKKLIHATINQQTMALMQISDLRHAIAGLKQRIVEDRARNDAMGVASGTAQLEEAVKTIGDLREVIHAVQGKRTKSMEKLKGMLTAAEYGSVETTVANQIKLMETRVKQYHMQPEADAIECHTESHFGGDGYIMKKGFYDYPEVGGIGYNKLKSLKIGKDVQVKLYQLGKRKGNIITYVGPRRVSLLPTLWDVGVSGIEVLPKTGPVVECYDAPFFQGGHVRLPVGFYDYPEVGGIGAGKLASIIIPAGLQVTFYSRPKGEGERIVFFGAQKMDFLTADWNRKVFGMTVAQR